MSIGADLKQILDSEDYDEFGESLLQAAHLQMPNFELTFKLRSQEGWDGYDWDGSNWQITASAVVDYHIISSYGEALWIGEDHPLLWMHTVKSCMLGITGKPTDPIAAFNDIHRKHEALVHGWVEFPTHQLLDILVAGYGAIRNLPVPLAREWEAALSKHAIRCSISEWHTEPKHSRLQAMVFGSSYVIAERFDSVRVNATSAAG